MSASFPSSEYCVRRLKALADETRFHVLQLLREQPRSVGEINTLIPIEQSLLSHHLKILRNEGLVTAKRVGKGVLYELAPDVAQFREQGFNLGCCLLQFKNTTKTNDE
ncbi:MAG: metalloregulator ArsR/SmtB family transcription factor [Cyanobacteria bacterium]|jgi:ArsR family transcriptional regulator|nr:metalloregulator ArsR/SmtB family transcription factor [Cyanobacteria bacterium GSL.Bin21]